MGTKFIESLIIFCQVRETQENHHLKEGYSNLKQHEEFEKLKIEKCIGKNLNSYHAFQYNTRLSCRQVS